MATRYDLIIEKGADWAFDWTWKTVDGVLKDLSNVSEVKCDFRNRADDVTALLSFTVANGKVTVNEGTSTITLSLTAVQTAALTFSEALYDILIVYDDGSIRKLFKGDVTLYPAVTK